MNAPSPLTAEPVEDCPRCGKPPALCVCADITTIDNRVAVLILQHPQEQDRELGSARLAALSLTHATLKTGLSWPSLPKALGKQVDPKRWAILYLGSASAETLPRDREIVALDAKGVALPDRDQAKLLGDIQGIIVIDGSWSQAKTLWWRNAWVLKCRRVALNPKRKSLYGKLRREPRREGLATIEAIGLALSLIERRPEIATKLDGNFMRLLNRFHTKAAQT